MRLEIIGGEVIVDGDDGEQGDDTDEEEQRRMKGASMKSNLVCWIMMRLKRMRTLGCLAFSSTNQIQSFTSIRMERKR